MSYLKRSFIKKRNKPVILTFMCMLMLIVFCGCHNNTADDITDGEKTAGSDIEQSNPVKLDIDIIQTETGENALSISIEDFIKSFNSFYAKDNGTGYLGDVDEWQMFAAGPTFYNPNETTCFIYSEDMSVRSIPQMKVYADSIASGIYQISLSYDDHSYSIETYDMYEEMCFYTIRTIFPNETDKEIKEICELMLNAVDESFTLDKQDAEKMPELISYQKDGIGMYPYYVVGEMMEICIVAIGD